MTSEQLKLMILVKAAPILASKEEAVCVAGMTLDEKPKWIRLFPTPFRDLDDESKFKKYQEIELEVTRPRDDTRQESRTPILDTIKTGKLIDAKNWALRRERVQQLDEFTMCDLRKGATSKTGKSRPSLSIVRAKEKPKLLISKRTEKEKRAFTTKLESITGQQDLFDTPASKAIPLEFRPWKFKYKYYCLAPECKSHEQSIVDWEISALYRKVKNANDWKQKMQKKFCDEIWSDDRDTVLFVGNQKIHPKSFLILGIFWPPKSLQNTLLDFDQ